MSKKNNNKDSLENNHIQFEKENKIIDGITGNVILNKSIDDLEEDEDEEDNYSEKDKITQEILDNKLSFITTKEEENKTNKIIKNKNCLKKQPREIHKDLIENLFIELFEYHYNGISEEKKNDLEQKKRESNSKIEFFCTKLNKKFSNYILLILEQKIFDLINYIKNNIKIETVKDILDIKNSLRKIGKEINKIFEKPFQKTMKFDVSSILIILLIRNIFSDNKINISDEEYEKIVEIDSLEEKDRFEKYLEEFKSKIEKGDFEEGVEVYPVEDKKQLEGTKLVNNDSTNNTVENENDEDEKENDIIINENNDINVINENNEEKKDTFIIEDIININNRLKKNNYNNKENGNKNNNDNNINNNNHENKIENYSNIEDLVNYINGSDIKKKKKKKRKKKTKVAQVKLMEEKKDNNSFEKDDVFENFKTNIINFTNNLEKVKKVKPKISDAFLERLKLK